MNSVTHNPRVPYDLLHPIFEHLEKDKASLCAISLASKDFREEAQCILFRKVDTLERYAYPARVKFLHTIAASQTRLALFVHAYSHFGRIGSFTLEQSAKIMTREVENALKAMDNPKELTMDGDDSFLPDHAEYIGILSACTFRLERFAWKANRLHIDDLVDTFLVRQPTLKHLKLPYISSFEDTCRVVLLTTSPHLVSIAACWRVTKAFLAGRNISTVHSTDGIKDGNDTNIEPLTAELKGLISLSTTFPSLWRMKLSGLGTLKCLSSLTSLEVYGSNYYYFDRNQRLFVLLKTPELVSIVSELPALQTLILTSDSLESNQLDNEELARHIFARFGKHLRRIDIGNRIKGCSYLRYIPAQEPVQISAKEALELWL